MKLISHLLIALTATLVVACGGGGSQADQVTGIMDDITAVLKDVKDVDSAKAAKSKLEPLMTKMAEFSKGAEGKAGDETKTPSPEELKKITEATTAYGAEMTRVMMNPELNAILGEALVPKAE